MILNQVLKSKSRKKVLPVFYSSSLHLLDCLGYRRCLYECSKFWIWHKTSRTKNSRYTGKLWHHIWNRQAFVKLDVACFDFFYSELIANDICTCNKNTQSLLLWFWNDCQKFSWQILPPSYIQGRNWTDSRNEGHAKFYDLSHTAFVFHNDIHCENCTTRSKIYCWQACKCSFEGCKAKLYLWLVRQSFMLIRNPICYTLQARFNKLLSLKRFCTEMCYYCGHEHGQKPKELEGGTKDVLLRGKKGGGE